MIKYFVEKIDNVFFVNCENVGKDLCGLEARLKDVSSLEVAVRDLSLQEYDLVYSYCRKEGARDA